MSDTAGISDIVTVEFLLNSTPLPSGGCHLQFDRAAGQFSQLNESGVCSAGGSSVSGDTLTLDISMVPGAGITGPQNLYVKATSATGPLMDFQRVGAWMPPSGSGVPSAVAVFPDAGVVTSRGIQMLVSDSAGYSDIKDVEIRINSSLDIAGSCSLKYEWPKGWSLWDDSAATWVAFSPNAPPAVSGVCVPGRADYNIYNETTSGLYVFLNFQEAFAGEKNVYVKVTSKGGAVADFRQLATWTVVPSPVSSFAAVLVTPASGSGARQVFRALIADPKGYAGVQSVEMLVNSVPEAPGGCAVRYDAFPGQIRLANDDSTDWLSGVSQENSQCSLNVIESGVSERGNYILVSVSLAFTPQFSGGHNVYVRATSKSGAVLDWQQMGTWIVAP